MNPQTPKPELICPICQGTNTVQQLRRGILGDTDQACQSCGAAWLQSARKGTAIPATEPAAAGHHPGASCPACIGGNCTRNAGCELWDKPAAAGEAGPVAWRRREKNRPDATWHLHHEKPGNYSSGRPMSDLCDIEPLYDHLPAAQPLPAGGVDEEAERETFEGMLLKLRHETNVSRNESGCYCDDGVENRWYWWLARSRLSRGEGRDVSALRKYGDHEKDCQVQWFACTCGFSDAVSSGDLDQWLPISGAPKDGTLLILLVSQVDFTGRPILGTCNPSEDEITYRTIGSNNFDHDGEDVWKFAGWHWSQDCWTEGHGTPTHYRLMPAALASDAAQGK